MPAPHPTMRFGLVAGVLIGVDTRGMVLANTLVGGISPAATLKISLERGLSHNFFFFSSATVQ